MSTKIPTRQQQLEALKLNRLADVLLGIPLGSNLPPKRPMPDFWISDEERSLIARHLRRIAKEPTAILQPPKISRPRGAPRNLAQTHVIGLDYRVTLEKLEKSDAAIAELQNHWKTAKGRPIARSAIFKAYKTCQTDRRWCSWAEHVILEAKASGKSLEAISLEIRAQS